MIADTLIEILLADAALVALIGSRIHAMHDPQVLDFPKVTFDHNGSNYGIDNDGVHISRHDFQIDCWGKTYKQTTAVSNAVIDALQLFDDTDVKKIVVNDAFDSAAMRETGKERQTIFRKTIRLTVSI